MSQSRQREWLADILESAPSIAFLALLRSGFELETAGWTGTAFAAVVLAGMRARGMRFNPILLGINIHILVATPFIVGVFRAGAPELGEILEHHAYHAVLATVFLTGLALTLWSPRGFIGLDGIPPASARKQSAVLLVAALAAVVWTFAYGGGVILGIAMPIVALLGLRRLLIARVHDSNQISGFGAVGAGAAFAHGYQGDEV